MSAIIDQYNDPTFAHLYVLTKDHPQVRERLKTASFDKAAADTLPDTAFAWPSERRFPIHTEEDTLASMVYRQKCASVPEHVDAKLAQAAEIYGLSTREKTAQEGPAIGTVSPGAQPPMSTEEQAMLRDPYFDPKGGYSDVAELKRKYEDYLAGNKEHAYAFPEMQRLPLKTAEQVLVAEHVLNRDFKKLPFEVRAAAYQRLKTAASHRGLDLQPFTMRLAGVTATSTDMLRDALETRATAAGPGKVREAFDKLAADLTDAPLLVQDTATQVKLASAVYELDKVAGLDKHYDRKLSDPMQTVFNTEIKHGEEMVDCAGSQVPLQAVMDLPAHVWEQLDVPELAEGDMDPSTFKQVFDTLPLDLKIAIKAYL